MNTDGTQTSPPSFPKPSSHLQLLLVMVRGHRPEVAAHAKCPVMRLSRSMSRAFTLVELLVVIAIVALLITLSLPLLSRAKAIGKQCKELAAGKQLLTAFAMYADASKGLVLTGYPTRSMVSGPIVVRNDQGLRLTGEDAQRYPWRLAPWLDYNFKGLYGDDQLLSQVREGRDRYAQFGVSYEYVVSLFPSLGMNVAFVGGSERFNAFDRLFRARYGKVFIERAEEAVRPSRQIVFASARCEEQALAPELGRPDGFFRVEPPRFLSSQGVRWESAYLEGSEAPGINSGFVSIRNLRRAVVAQMDGSGSTLDWDQLQDMTRWSNAATSSEWSLGG